MKWNKKKIQAFFGIEADVEHDYFSKDIKISISLWHFVWIIAIIAFLVYRHYH